MTIACPDCGTEYALPPPPPRSVVTCTRCGGELERTTGTSVGFALAMSSAVLVLLVPANLLPFLSTHMYGEQREMWLGSAVNLLLDSGWLVFAAVIAILMVALPVVRFTMLTAVLAAVHLRLRPAWLGQTFRYATALEPWAMTDILLIGLLIGYTRLGEIMPVEIQAGGWCFLAAAPMAMMARAALDRRALWRFIRTDVDLPAGETGISCTTCELVVAASAEGSRCPRCTARLHGRKPEAMRRTAALTIAALILYVPANTYPMTVVTRMGDREGQIIVDGVQRLVIAELYPLAVIIFTASILIPVVKLAVLFWCVASVNLGWRRGLLMRTKLYRSVDTLGRWSNIDIMTIAVFAPLMQFGGIASAEFGGGAMAFFAVVVLTMLASGAFDARLMWDVAERGR